MAADLLASRVRLSSHERLPLTSGWSCLETPPAAITDPAALPADGWIPFRAPGTAATALRDAGRWTIDDARDFDASDWWFRCRLPALGPEPTARDAIRFDGIATVAEAWLDGAPILRSGSMFRAHACDVTGRLAGGAELSICCRALGPRLADRRPRPRWRTRLVRDQGLRWFRTTLLGRMPAWSPPVAPVGPWRPIVLERRRHAGVTRLALRPTVEGDAGRVDIELGLAPARGAAIERASLVVGDEHRARLELLRPGDETIARGTVRVPAVRRWWPHTHGEPARYTCRVELVVAGERVDVDLGPVGFRAIEADRRDDGFGLVVNGVPVFARGACWTTTDIASLGGPAGACRRDLVSARDAGMNMIRLGGTMAYEQDAFYDACDELGILLWQDFMFANMDYPADDPAFRDDVEAEATQLLARLAGRPSLAVLCGGSEVEQQAAMLGLSTDRRRSPLFDELLPRVCAEHRPDVPWLPSTPTGGGMPFYADRGVTHYYGVGAYLRPLDDARRAEVRFAAECLAFANVPEPAVCEGLMARGAMPGHDPLWKARVPRDAGAGWDFEDVRDRYVERLFGVRAAEVRYADPERYLALGRAATGEVMAAVFGEWRRRRSTARGALVWFLRDLWPGAGWGVLDSTGGAKAAYHYLRRALAPVAAHISDEGVNGLRLHLVNDRPAAVSGRVAVACYLDSRCVGEATAEAAIPPHGATESSLDAMFDGFRDLSYAYRFGPPAQDLVVATLYEAGTGARIAEAMHFPLGLPSGMEHELGLEAELTPGDGVHRLTVRTRRFAQSVALDAAGCLPSDDYFHLAPGAERRIELAGAESPAVVELRALNARHPARATIAR